MATPIPSNSAEFTLGEVAHAVGATCSEGHVRVTGVTTDSRDDVRGKLFVALSGERFDGNRFAEQAAQQGAAAILTDAEGLGALNVPVLRTASALRALGDLANHHRIRWGGKLVAIAGSAGKTTTRVAVETVLRAMRAHEIHATVGNLNNLIGVPMTLLGLAKGHQIAVVEVGTNAPGEVQRLAAICQPNVSILTLIGLEHTEGLGDLDGIEREESSIFSALGSTGLAIGNGDDVRVNRLLAQLPNQCRHITYGMKPGVDYRVSYKVSQALETTDVSVCCAGSRQGGKVLGFTSRLLGMPGAMAITAGVAAADALGVSLDLPKVNQALVSPALGEQGRLKATLLDDSTLVLDDSYNANPPSMASSVALANQVATQRRSRLVVVLGEMRELGSLSQREHAELGAHLGQAAEVIAVGLQTQALYEAAKNAGHSAVWIADAAAAVDAVRSRLQPGDVVLIKGSRGVHLETVAQAIIAQKGCAA